MSDVRLTATNPEDSSVVPVACNSSGELLLEAIPDQSFDGDLDGDLTVSGTSTFAGAVLSTGWNVNADQSGFYINKGNVYAHKSSGTSALPAFIVYSGAGDGVNNRTVEIFGNGSAEFAGQITTGNATGAPNTSGVGIGNPGYVSVTHKDRNSLNCYSIYDTSSASYTCQIKGDGSAAFKSEVIVGSRGKQWTLTEQSGLCHMVEVTRAATADLVEPDEKYPKLRDVFHELDLIEQALEQVMTQLRLDPPAGWPVWDGSDNLSGTD